MSSNLFRQLFFSQKGIRIIWIIIVLILFIIISEIMIVDLIGSLLGKVGIPEDNGITAHNWPQVFGAIIKRGIRSAMVVLSVFLTVKWLLKKPFDFIGWRCGRHQIVELFIGIGLGFIIQLVPLFLMWIFGWYRVVGFSWNFNPLSMLAPALIYAFIYSMEAGVIEEPLFRGVLMNIIADRYDLTKAVIFSSLLFGLLHFSGVSNEFPWWMSVLSATLGGFLFAQAYLLYGNLWMPLGIHFAWHFAARILGTDGVTISDAAFLVTEVEGPTLLIVTKSGGASLFELIGVGMVSLIIWFMRKKITNNA